MKGLPTAMMMACTVPMVPALEWWCTADVLRSAERVGGWQIVPIPRWVPATHANERYWYVVMPAVSYLWIFQLTIKRVDVGREGDAEEHEPPAALGLVVDLVLVLRVRDVGGRIW
jgi:hypothetical protein